MQLRFLLSVLLLGTSPLIAADAAKAAFTSPVITKQTPGHAAEVDVDITGWKQLHLAVNDASDGFTADWADWIEPRLVDASGKETKLTDLKWTAASAQWGQPRVGANAKGDALKVNGQPVAYGIGTHANSLISYALPDGHKFTRFKARAGLDNGGSDQGEPAAFNSRCPLLPRHRWPPLAPPKARGPSLPPAPTASQKTPSPVSTRAMASRPSSSPASRCSSVLPTSRWTTSAACGCAK